MASPPLDEQRDFVVTLQLRDAETTGRPGHYRYLEGRAVPYDTWARIGWFYEMHRHGSFKRSTNGRNGVRLPLLVNHGHDRPIGHAESWSHPDDGLHGVWKLNDTPEAQRTADLAVAGDMIGLSVGFSDAVAPEWEYPREMDLEVGPWPKVTRLESRLVEVSVTPTPAFVDAEVVLVRTRARRPTPPEREVERWRRWYAEYCSR